VTEDDDECATAPPAAAAPSPKRIAGFRSSLDGIVPAVIDQLLVSGTNFITVLMVARAVSASELGAYSVVMAIGLLLANSQAALIAKPLSAIGVTRPPEQFGAYIAATARLQVIGTAGTTIVVASLGLLASAIWDVHFVELLFIALPLFVFWQLQELTRRVMFAQNRPRAVLLNDMVSYGLQAVMVAGFLAAGRLTVVTALSIAASTSALGVIIALVQAPQLRQRPESLSTLWRENWKFGRWIVLADSIHAVSSRLYIYLSAALLSTATTGVLQAISQVSNVLNVFMFALMSTLMPRFARTLADHGTEALHRVVTGWMVATTAGAALILAVPFFTPETTLGLLFGGRYDGNGDLLRLQLVAALVWIPTYMLTLAIYAHRASWIFPITQACNLAIACSLGAYLLLTHGLAGALIASGITGILNIAIYTVAFRRANIDPVLRTTETTASRAKTS
jgi:O-antigen/teichoic acid export membrane protein